MYLLVLSNTDYVIVLLHIHESSTCTIIHEFII